MKTLALLAAAIFAALSLASCGLSPAASAGRQGGGSYASGDDSGGTPFLGKN